MMVVRAVLLIAACFLVIALLLPLGEGGSRLFDSPPQVVAALLAIGALSFAAWRDGAALIVVACLVALYAAVDALILLREPAVAGAAQWGFWALVAVAWVAASVAVAGLSRLRPRDAVWRRLLDIAVPLAFGAFLFFLWEVVIRGFGVPSVLMPAPSMIAAKFFGSLPVLASDFVQTFVRGVLTGYLIGSLAGFLAAIVADGIPFLQRGLLPLGNFVAALPIVGIAPIMVMWFGFDWPSKAAVVVVMTFFPMLVNAVAGLASAGRTERDLMSSYGANYLQTLLKVRLPAAMPFIFNALKINSTLALIGGIVAEFFGTPVVGMGFRISIEVARMSLDMVWAEIALAALAGTVFYGLIALAERATTFWHPSFRS
jgi:NitT/TauT family transport system permease protein